MNITIMRLLHYNVLYETVHLQLLEEIIAETNPDIISLNEVQAEEIEALQKWYATAFARTSKEGRHYGNALAWKQPLPMYAQQAFIKGLKTPLVSADFGDYNIYCTHLAATEGEERRMQEVQQIISLLPAEKEVLLVGDMNSLSPHDGYDTAVLEAAMRKHGHVKFGIPVQFQVISELERQGLVDIMRARGCQETTVPTTEGISAEEKAQHFMPLRLDYVFGTAGIAGKATKAQVLKNSFTEKCSDHYPLLVDFGIY